MSDAATVCESPNDLSLVVDGLGNGLNAAWGIDSRINATAVEEAVFLTVTVLVKAQRSVPNC